MADVFSFVQILGYIGFCFGVGASLQKKDLRLKLFGCGEALTYIVHFYLLGNNTAVALLILSFLRNIASIYGKSIRTLLWFTTASLVFGVWYADQWYALFAVAGQMTSTIALLGFSGIKMRLFLVMSAALWLVNNALSGSIGGSMLEVFILLANLLTIYRLSREHSSLLHSHR